MAFGVLIVTDLVSDDFSDGTLDGWTVVGPTGTSAQIDANATDAYLELVTPDGDFDLWGTDINTVRAMQLVSDGDFQLDARFLTTPSQKYQMQGFLVEQDGANWIRFDTYSDGSKLHAFAAVTVNGVSTTKFDVVIPGGSAPYLQLTHTGSDWALEYSTDGTTWTTAGSFSQTMTVSEAGVFAGNTGQATGYTAQVDYVENTASPIVDEDAALAPSNVAPVAHDDALAAAIDTPLLIHAARDLLGNDTDANGDALSLGGFDAPTHGTLVDNGDGTLTYTPDAGYSGADSFTYTVTDGELTDTATVSLTVAPLQAIISDDFSGDTLNAGWSFAGAAGASVQLGANATDAYLELVTPDGNFDLWGSQIDVARVMQSISDGDFQLATRFLTAPSQKYQMQGFLVEQDGANWIRFDTYSDGSKLHAFAAVTVNGVSTTKFDVVIPGRSAPYLQLTHTGSDWALEYSTDGTTWTTAGSFSQAMTVSEAGVFAGNTGQATGYTAQVDYFFNTAAPIVPEDPPNTPPDAVDDALATAPDAALVITTASLLANDGDSDGDHVSFAGFTQPTHGTLVDNGDGTLTYTPNSGFLGVDSFTYTASDGEDGTQATVTVAVADPTSTPPVAVDDSVTTAEDTPVVIAVLANDSDPDSDPLSLQSLTQPGHGTLVDNGDGTLTYTPEANFNGADSFTYTVTDGRGQSASATATVTIDPVNDTPAAVDDAFSTDLNQALVISVTSGLLGNDTDVESSPLSLADFSQPAHGTLVDNGDGTLTYTPDTGFIGTDSFTYTASDGTDPSNPAAVSLKVGLPAGVVSDDFSGDSLTSEWFLEGPDSSATAGLAVSGAESYLEIFVPTGDHDAYGGVNKAVRVMQDAENGDFGAEVKFLSTPSGNIQDQGILVEQDATNWLRFDTYSNNGKTYVYGGVTTDGVTATKFNTVVAAGSASHLRVERSGDVWTFKYSADGIHWTTAGSYTQVLDVTEIGPFAGNTTGAPSYTAQVDYFFNTAAPIVPEDPPNTPPDAVDDALATAPDAALVITTASLLANDGDSDGDHVSFAGFTQPTHGTLVDNGDGTLTYTPNSGFLGVDSFTYTASDGEDGTQATVTVAVADPTSTPPVAVDDSVTTAEDTPVVIAVLANDSDPDSDPLSLQSLTQPGHGTLVDNGDGTLTYTPEANFNGADSFTYTVTDGRGQSASATATVTIDPVNDTPAAVDDAFSTDLNQALVISVTSGLLGNDTDVESSPLSLADFSQPAHGTLVDNGDGTLTYTPDTGFIGTDSFTYTASDGTDPSNPALVRLEVGLPANIFSDDFNTDSLTSEWSLAGPAATADLVTVGNEAYVELSVPQGNYDAWDVNNTTRLMQAADDENFGIETKFLSIPTQKYQIEGILVQQDANNWLRFDTLNDGNGQRVFAGVTTNGDSSALINISVPTGTNYLRVERAGDLWTLEYSSDGSNWHIAGSFSHSLTVTETGVFAGSADAAPGFTAQVDYFFNTAAPIVPEDAIPVPPVAVDDIVSTAGGAVLAINVAADLLANDTDLNNDVLTLAGFEQPSHGSLVDDGDGTLTYTPAQGFAGVDAFNYTVTDGTFQDSGIVHVGVDDTAPMAQGEAVATNEDTPLVIDVLANDSDANGDAISVFDFVQPGNGTVAVNSDGTLTYTPNADFHGADSFTYSVGDGVLSDVATVNLTVNSVPDAPVANDDSLATLPGEALLINVANDLLVNDTDGDNDPLSLLNFAQPAHGTLADNGDGTLTYTPEAGFSGTDGFTYTVDDGTGLTDSAAVQLVVADAIDVWYGTEQTFGDPGAAQKWINILGNVDTSEVTSLSYSLNGGADQELSLGPDGRRLQHDGDFNIDIGYSALDGTAADDIVTIKATLADGGVQTKDVIVHYEAGQTWSPDYSIDWSATSNIQDAAQVIDGLWGNDSNGVHPVETGYDRLLGIGDYTWDNYEASLQITTNDTTAVDPVQGISGAFGIGMLWNGHTDYPISGAQPKEGYVPISAFVFRNGQIEVHASNWTTELDVEPFNLEQGVTYDIKFSVEQVNVMDRQYSLKIWKDGTPEPTDWNVQGVEHFTQPTTGSIAPFIHYWDVSLGDITVTEIPGNDILPGTSGNDTLVAVDTSQANPGAGEIDVLQGFDGADTFVFGDANGSYYDDGNAATAGTNDYGLIWDFVSGTDRIQLAGTAADYVLTADTTGLASGTDIWLVGQNGAANELIAAVNGVSGLNLNSNSFVFTGDLVA